MEGSRDEKRVDALLCPGDVSMPFWIGVRTVRERKGDWMAFRMGLMARKIDELRVCFEGEFVESLNVFICTELISEDEDAFCMGSGTAGISF